MKLDSVKCLASVDELSIGSNYARAYGPALARLTHTSLQHSDARVTFGVRIHDGVEASYLDDAINSLRIVLAADEAYRTGQVVSLND